MKSIKDLIERKFEALAAFLYDNRLKALLFCVLCWGLLIPNIRHLEFDTSNEGFLHEKDPILIEYNSFRDQFGRDEVALVTVKSKDGIFSLPFINKLKNLHDELADNVPYLDDITSLVNARYQFGREDALVVDDFMEEMPQSESDVENLRKRALTQPNYINMLINEELTVTSIVLKSDTYSGGRQKDNILEGFDDEIANDTEPAEYLTAEENAHFVNSVKAIINEYNSDDFETYITGSAVVTDSLKRWMLGDVKKFIRLSVVVIGLFLFLMFRRFSCVAIPLIIVFLTLFSTIAIMALTGVKFKLPTSILPSFLLAVGVGASVHLLTIVIQQLKKGESKRDAVIYASGHSGLPIFLTSLTTAGGLLSFANADVAPIAELGVFASVGVMLSFVYTVVLTPVFLSLIPFNARKKELGNETEFTKTDMLLGNLGRFAVRRRKLVLIVAAVLFILSIAGISKVRFSHDTLSWIPSYADVSRGTVFTDKAMKGSVNMEFILDTGETNGLYSPELLKKIDQFDSFAENYHDKDKFVGNSNSLSDILKEINRALNENRDSHYTIPDDRILVAQEFLLFENSGADDLEDFVDTQFSKTRISMKTPWLDSIKYIDFVKTMSDKANEYFEGYKVAVTGVTVLFARIMAATIYSMAESYVIAAFVISLMMVLMIGRLRLGLLSMIPNLLPILMAIAVIGWFSLPMDLFTMMVGSIAIGLAVDDTIHFMHNFVRYFNLYDDVEKAVEVTMQGTGKAMFTTSVVLAAGFLIYMMATMKNLYNFGLITAVAVIFALVGNLVLAPALMGVFAEKFRNKSNNI